MIVTHRIHSFCYISKSRPFVPLNFNSFLFNMANSVLVCLKAMLCSKDKKE